jgi:hypothetical protein
MIKIRAGIARLKRIWARRSYNRLVKEMHWRIGKIALTEAELQCQRKQLMALMNHITSLESPRGTPPA